MHAGATKAAVQDQRHTAWTFGDLPELPRQAEDALRNGFRRGISLRRVRAAVEGALLAGGGFDNVVRH